MVNNDNSFDFDKLNTFFTNMQINKNSKNINIFIGIISILVAFWAVLYAIPSLFATLFHTLLGNLILILCAIFMGMFHLRAGITAFVVIVILYQFSKYGSNGGAKEGFDKGTDKGTDKGADKKGTNEGANTNTWSKQTIYDFIKYIRLMYPESQINMNVLQSQATEDEVRSLIANKTWAWSQETKDLYINAVSRNSIIKVDPGDALAQSMKIYNNNAARHLLSWNTKEGQFLTEGIDLGPSAGEPLFVKDKKHDTIKCAIGNDNNIDESYMEKTTYYGAKYFSGLFKMKKERISNENLPNEIAGFSFIKGSCNPCVALNTTPDYSCPFKVNVKGDDTVSNVWSKLWGL